MLNRIKSMTLCGQMSAITIVSALCAALGVAAWTGERGAYYLAVAIMLIGAVGLLLEFFGPKPACLASENTEQNHAR